MLKYSIITCIILIFSLLYQVNQLITIKKIAEKRVEGISTQIKQLEQYQEDISTLSLQ